MPRRWQLDFKPGPLRMATLDLPGQGRQSFFYMTYKVTNTSGQDLLLAPAFDLSTDDGDLVRSGRNVSGEATRQILDLVGNPLVEDQIGILGVIMQGEENTKQGVVIWPVPAMHIAEVSVYASGFSGETKKYPTKDPKTGEPVESVLRKQHMSRYQMPGDLDHLGNTAFSAIEDAWIMR